MSLRLLNGLVPTFETMSKKHSGLFRMSTYNTPAGTALLNEVLCDMYHRIEGASPTQFHLVIAALAKEARLLRLYTQNIDGIDTQLPLMNTLIPLPLKGPWPKTVQLHGNLRTIRCLKDPTHLAPFDPALFGPGSLPGCAECEKDERENEAKNEDKRRARLIPVVRPRICLYEDNYYADAVAISEVQAADCKKKIGAVIVVGTALKVPGAKRFAKEICRRARECGGFTAWINLNTPPRDLDCLDLIIKGDCETVAWHVSSWWLKECPNVLSDTQIQELQKKCKLFIEKSAEAALTRALTEVDNDSVSKILQQHQNKSGVRHVAEGGKAANVLVGNSQNSGLKSKAIDHNIETESSETLPRLPDCWETDMRERLKNVEIQVTIREKETVRESSSVLTTIADCHYQQHYKESDITKSLWHLKPGEYLNDEIINAYLELLQSSGLPAGHYIQHSYVLKMKPDNPWKKFRKIIGSGTYSIYIPINDCLHWTFAVITDNPVSYTYYDSLGGEPPLNFLTWIHKLFPKQEIKQLIASPNPKQKGFVDCGLFVILGIRLLLAGRRHSQAQCDEILPKLRQRVLAELLACTLDPTSSQFDDFKNREAQASKILSHVNPPDKVGDKSTSGTVRGPNRQVNGPSENNKSKLFVSPSPVARSRKDPETDSSDESEEEIVQLKPSTGKVLQKKKKTPEQIASNFGEEALMVKMLREAVAIERASQSGARKPKIENIQLPDLWFMISTEKQALKQRHVHYEFSRQFWAEVGELNKGSNQRSQVPKFIISQMMSKLEITSGTSWKYILQRARRASVWTELTDIFKPDLEDPSVVLCAVPDATYTLETMTLTNRKVLFEIIRSRVKEPGNGILARLKAASALYRAAMYNDLPVDLPIESGVEHLPFKDVVSCRKS
jgi:NAD-dependent histone deacetylase SIR2